MKRKKSHSTLLSLLSLSIFTLLTLLLSLSFNVFASVTESVPANNYGNIQFKPGSVSYYDNGQLEGGTVDSDNASINGLPLLKGHELEFYENGQVAVAYIAADTSIAGFLFKKFVYEENIDNDECCERGRIIFHENGSVRSGYIKEDGITIDGIRVKGNTKGLPLSLASDGTFRSGHVEREYFKRGDKLIACTGHTSLDDDKELRSCTLDDDITIDGERLKRGTKIHFENNGKIYSHSGNCQAAVPHRTY
ncbi:MAG: hypothetical protein HQK49_06705 [Oligoflexia bacterium]|nr:hypothetical protein [Oligoflexia bacterium]